MQKDEIKRDISARTDLSVDLTKQFKDIQNEITLKDNAIGPSLKYNQCEEESEHVSRNQDEFEFSLDSTESETMTPITTPMKPAPPIRTTPLRGNDCKIPASKVPSKLWWHIKIRDTLAHQFLDVSSWMFLCLLAIYMARELVSCMWVAAEYEHERQFLLLMNQLTHGNFKP
jgi:hypothetical protein